MANHLLRNFSFTVKSSDFSEPMNFTNLPVDYINKIQRSATVCRYLFTAKSLSRCFGCPSQPSSGVHKTVTAASGTGHSIWATAFLQRGLIRPQLEYKILSCKTNKWILVKHILLHVANYQHFSFLFAAIIRESQKMLIKYTLKHN